jgi:hypothetical protein
MAGLWERLVTAVQCWWYRTTAKGAENEDY